MFNRSDMMRVIAARYLRLAKEARDRGKRSSLLDRAMIYGQLSERAKRRKNSRITEHRDVSRRPERRDGVARSHGR